MNAVQFQIDQTELPLCLNLNKFIPRRPSDDDFFDFCQQNQQWRIEMNHKGDITIMPNTGGKTGDRNSEINFQLRLWLRQNNTGKVFDSSTTFNLPNKAKRSPDASWLAIEKWNALTEEQKEKFPPVCPDFVIELRSRTDSLKKLQAKMREYLENGAQLSWLIDPAAGKVYVYRPTAELKILENPQIVSGEPLLKGFELDTTDIFK